MTILSDHPAHERDGDSDQIGLNPRLAAVLDILRHKHTHCPVTIAIYGDWGTGKSSAMRWLAREMKEWNAAPPAHREGHPCVYPVWFDPWKYQTREDVWRGIIAEVILAFFHAGMSKENFILRMTSAVKQFGGMLGRMLLDGIANTSLKLGVKPAEVAIDGKALSEIVEEYRKTTRPEKAYFNEFEQTLKEWIGAYLEHDSRLCLFIDDLDRCLPEVTLEVLEALKLYLNIPQLIFVVGLDRTVVDGVVRKHYDSHGLGVDKARHYLDKIFQVEVAIAPSQTQVESGYFAEQVTKLNDRTGGYWDDMLSGNGYKAPIEDAVLMVAGNNPREIKRLLNSTLRSGREAAERTELGNDPRLLFAQGAQSYLLLRCVQFFLEPPQTVNNLLLSINNVTKLDQISKYLQQHIGELDGVGIKVSTADTKGSKWKELMAETPEDDQLKKLNPSVFEQRSVQELLAAIPFSAAVAQAATPTPMPTPTPTPTPELPDILTEKLEGVDRSKVTTLDLSGLRIKDDDLAYIGEMTQLQTLSLDGTKVSGAGLEHLKPLTQLQELNLRETHVGDKELEHLKPLTQLKKLCLNGTKVGDKGLRHLKPLTQLKGLYVNRTDVTDAGLQLLAPLMQLQEFDLDDTRVSDVGIKHLKTMIVLRRLSLHHTSVGDPGLAHLKPLTQLQWLSLSGTKVSDAGLAHLKPLTQLRSLYLGGTQVSDAGLEHLKPLTQLQRLTLEGTKVTEAGVKRLKELLPRCSILG